MLLVVAFYKLPRFRSLSPGWVKLRDALVAGVTGLFFALLSLSAFSGVGVSELGRWFASQSYIAGKGQNVVNVILVDFRAMDTLGEITVVAVAAIGVLSLLRLRQDHMRSTPQNLPELPVCEDREANC